MSVRSRSLAAGLGVLLLAAGALTACATPVGAGTDPTANTGDDRGGGSAEIEIDAAWLDGGRMIGVITQGSSTCVPMAGEATYEAGVLSVEFEEPADTACTADYAPRVTLVGVPEGVDPTQDLEIRVTGDGYTGSDDLDGAPGLAAGGSTDYLPSAGWTDTDGQFIILTWGSSSCPPLVEDVAATTPTEVLVTFAEPAADQVCTMDMAPRATLAYVDGTDDDVFAVLTGAEFDDVRIPIVGDN